MALGDTILVGPYNGNASRCIDDIAYIAQASSQAAAIVSEATNQILVQAALMLMRRTMQEKISDMQEALAKRRVKLAQDLLAHAQETWVKEQEFVAETMAEAAHAPEYTEALVMQAELDAHADAARTAAIADRACMGVPLTPCDDSRLARGMAVARTDIVGHALRSAEARSIQLNDRRFSRQLTVLGLGRGKLATALSFGQIGGASAEVVHRSLMRSINSGVSLWGYLSNRWQHGGNYATGPNGAPRVVNSVVPRFSDGRYDPPPAPIVVNVQPFRGDETAVGYDPMAFPEPGEPRDF
jgi:hypothetical protein